MDHVRRTIGYSHVANGNISFSAEGDVPTVIPHDLCGDAFLASIE